jgi:murein DD-endopeptidase MepM/ murein hydrolase activator NlpD
MKRTCLVLSLVVTSLSVALPRPAFASGTWTWPVGGPVVRAFDPPGSPYGSGHRGIDVAAPVGTVVRAPAAGIVTFAGSVGGRSFVTIDHGGGLLSTCSFLSGLLVRKDDVVVQGQPVALSGSGHVGDISPDVHLGVRLAGQYVDPLDYLAAMSIVDLIRLAPIAPSSA